MGSPAETGSRLRRVVSNTGPLLHLSEAQALPLRMQTGEVYIPRAVDVEMEQRDSMWHNARPSWIHVETLLAPYNGEATAWRQAGLLDAGEAEAALNRLAQSSLWVSANVLAEARSALDQRLS